MSITPTKPSELALWIDKHGSPDQLKVEYRQTGTDTADTWVILTCTHSKKSIEIMRYEIGSGYNSDTELRLSHASIVELTEQGRKLMEEWKAFNKKEARDLSEYKRLKDKFGNI